MYQKTGANQKNVVTAISSMIAVVVIIVIIIIAAGSLILLSQAPKTTSTNTTSQTSSSLATTTSTTSSSSTTTSSSSSSSTSTSTSARSTSSYSGRLLVSFADPNAPTIGPNLNLSYPIQVNSLGNLPSSVAFSPVSSSGISITFSPNNVSLGAQVTVNAMLSVGHNVTPGTYNLQATAAGGGGIFNASLSVQVVQYVVAIQPAFTPANLTVTSGSTVTWVRLNGVLGEHADNGSQNVVFNNGIAQSPQLAQYASYSYQFTQTGNFPYHSTYRNDNGEITVIAG